MASGRNNFGGVMKKKEYEKLLKNLPDTATPADIAVMICGIVHVYNMEESIAPIFATVLGQLVNAGMIDVDESGQVVAGGARHSKVQLH